MLDSHDNPYQSPAAASDPIEPGDLPALGRAQVRALNVGGVVIAWEKRRLWYNVILAVASAPIAVALAMGSSRVGAQEFKALVWCAIVANVLYLAGPIVEGYWTWFFGPARWLRPTLFFAGSVLAVILALVIVASILQVL